ncbi:FAD-dependent oxidoreductase [Nocardioides humilatus]|uniref:FAD-dependent oxidoreductase n=1 Tax=Nocardioides humilatus TaxID=2607660 RepID=UPI00165F9FBF|nr:FAD-dependent oxidoreductase [Nocardioides humilatus]
MPDEVEVLVVGAGLAGLATAVQMARAGRQVAVVEARTVGAATTGRTTGKISLLQGTKLTRIRDLHSAEVVEEYVAANRAGQDWLLDLCEAYSVEVQRRDAVTYAGDATQVAAVRSECDAAAAAGLPVTFAERWDSPIPHHGAVILRDQAQCDPAQLLTALVDELKAAGGTVHEGHRMVRVSLTGRPEVTLDGGAVVRADDVVVATGAPGLDRDLRFASLTAQRSYLLAYSGIEGIGAMAISAGSPTHSFRDVPGEEPVTLVGGAGHPVGRTKSEVVGVDRLRGWVVEQFPDAVETHCWSAQDYSPANELPVAETIAIGSSRLHVLTGFDKWGLTTGVAAAFQVSDRVLGRRPGPWPRSAHVSGKAVLRTLTDNLQTAQVAATDWARAALPGGSPDCKVVGVCTHLGGRLRWNDAEQTWDCPLHGSRFSEDGAVLEGPAKRPLRQRD